MTLGLGLKIVARKRQVAALALGLAVITMVSTAITQAGGLIQSANSLAEKLLRPGENLVYTGYCTGSCARQCTVTVKAGGGEAVTSLTIIPEGLSAAPKPPVEGVGVGIILSQDLGVGEGDNITIIRDGISQTLPVTMVYRAGSPLDYGLIAGSGFDWCNDHVLAQARWDPSRYTRVFSLEVGGLVSMWGLASLIVLGIGGVVASVKAYMDLEGELGALTAEGGSWRILAGGLAVVYAVAVLAGYGWGLILTDLLDSIVAGLTGLYIPRGDVSPYSFTLHALIPSVLTGLTALLVGAVIAGRRDSASP